MADPTETDQINKILRKRELGAVRARNFRANQLLNNPDFLNKKAQYAKDQRLKEKQLLEANVEKVKELKTIRAKQEQKGNKIPTSNIPIIKPQKPVIIPKQPIKKETKISDKEGIYYDETGMILLSMSYFQNIDYSISRIPKWTKDDNKKLTDSVIKESIQKLKIIYEEYFEIPFTPELNDIIIKILKGDIIAQTDIMYLKYHDDFLASPDFKNHMEFLARKYTENPRSGKPSLNTFITYINPIVNVISRIDHIDFKKNYETVSNIMTHLKNIYTTFKKHNIMKIDQNGNKKKIDYGNTEYIKKSIDKTDLTTENKALAALYLLFPTRRIKDYQLMKKTTDINDTTDLNNNYLLVDTDNNIISFTFNNHKTYKTYKTQVYDITEYKDLNSYLKPHIDKKNNGDYLFSVKDNKPLVESSFSHRLKKLFTKIFTITLTLDDVRACSESYNMNTPGRTTNQKEQYSIMMGHSLETGMSYPTI